MAAINLPFGASASRRAPTTDELANGFPCGAADIELFNWLHWYATGQIGETIELAGLTQDDTDQTQLVKAIRSGSLNWALAAGTANALTVSLSPVLASVAAGMPLRIVPALANTGAATLNGDPIVHRDGTALVRGDLLPGVPVSLTYYSGSWYLVGISYGEVLPPLRNDTTFYVRTDGSDSNDGLTNSAAGAFQTLAGAYSSIRSRYYPNGRAVTLQLGLAGNYVGFSHNAWPGLIIARGDPANPANFNLVSSGGGATNMINGLNNLEINGCKITSAASSTLVLGLGGGLTRLRNIHWVQGGSSACIDMRDGARCIVQDPHTISGSGGRIAIAGSAATINFGESSAAAALTLTGTPTYSQGFVTAYDRGGISNINASYSGAASGARYQSILNGVINVQGGGANVFPGSVAGTTSTGGQYA